MKLQIALSQAVLAATFMAAFATSPAAQAQGKQVCVDSKGASYTADITGVAKPHEDFEGILKSDVTGASIPNGTNLDKIRFKENLADSTDSKIEDLSYQLKHLVAPTLESLQEGVEISYPDEPRVYEANGVDLLCSSTMTEEEFASLAK